MIARIWRGRTPAARAPDYLRLMHEVALPDYRIVPGNLGAWCLHRDVDDGVEFTMLTFWEDMEAVRGFAGNDPSIAKYYGFDAEYLLDMPRHVEHHDVD